MYGSEHLDLVVKYYDQTFAYGIQEDIDWFSGKVKRYGGPVLDLACGTGRVALQLAKDGYRVTAIDHSEGMLALFRRKLAGENPKVLERLRIEQAEMENYSLGEKYRIAICVDAFYHNLSDQAQIACLNAVRAHLLPEGRFIFNVPNPTCEFILAAEKSGGKQYSERGRYDLENGRGSILIEQANAADFREQIIITTLRITRFSQLGEQIEQGLSSWKTRFIFKYEAVHLLARCGFEVESLVGDYQDNAVSEGSQLIFVAKVKA